jgi:ribose transport system substrate-binding protein
MKSAWLARMGALSLVSVMVIGCSSAAATPTAAPATATPGSNSTPLASAVASAATNGKTGPFVIGVSNDSVANAFRVQMENEIKYYAQQHPELISNLIVLDAGGDTNKQISDVEDLITRKVDAIVLSPNSSTALNPAISDAKAAGIPVVTYNMSVTDSTDVLTQVAPPFQQWEKDQTTWLAQQMGGTGNVIALRGIAGTPVDAEEWAGAQEVLAANPNIKVICTEYANWDYGAAKTAVQNCLANHPTVNGILSVGDAMTWAAGEVMATQGYDLSKIPMIGIGGGNGALKWWAANSKVNAQMIGDRTDVAVIATEDVINYLQGKTSATVAIPETVITNQNVSTYAQPSMPDAVWLVGTQLPLDVLKQEAGS